MYKEAIETEAYSSFNTGPIMENLKYHLIIEAEVNFNILIRILTRLVRNRIEIKEMHMQTLGAIQTFTITVSETKENVMKLSKRIDNEIDVHSIKILEQLISYE